MATPAEKEARGTKQVLGSGAPERIVKDAAELREDYAQGRRGFADAQLANATLGAAELSEIDLSGAVLTRANLNHTKLDSARCEGADLREADLTEAILADATFDAARLQQAKLLRVNARASKFRRVRAQEASFDGAELGGASFEGADLREAELRGAKLMGADLSQADLRGAKLSGANLSEAKLVGAKLEGACFLGADLSRADLSDAQWIGVDLGGARLAGASMPRDFHGFSSWVQSLNASGERGRAVFASLLGLLTYVLVTVATTTDIELVLNHARLSLPVVGASLPVKLFYLGAALAIVVLSGYLQIYLGQQARLIHKLPRVFPDGLSLVDKVHPWALTNLFAVWHIRSHTGQRSKTPALDTLVVAAIAWGLAPATSILLLVRFLTSQDDRSGYALWALAAVTLIMAVLSFFRVSRACGRVTGRATRIVTTLLILFGVLALTPGILRATGSLYTTAKHQDISTPSGSDWRGAYLEGASLRDAELSGSHLNKAILRYAHLHGAVLVGTHFDGADLTSADLSETRMVGASLRQADLFRAKLSGATFTSVDAHEARLREAHLERVSANAARFAGGDLVLARLDSADLSGASFKAARLDNAVLEGANLEQADFTEASLVSANLNSSKLEGAVFDGADLRFAQLVGVEGLSPAQVCRTRNWHLALLPGDEAVTTWVPYRISRPGPVRAAAMQHCPPPE